MSTLYSSLYTSSQDETIKARVKIGIRKEAILKMADALQVDTTISTDPVVIATTAANNALHKSKFDKINNFASSVLFDTGFIESMFTVAIAAKDTLGSGFTDVQLQAVISTLFPLMAGVRNYEV